MGERFLAHFAAGDWAAIAEMLADDYWSDDRRRVVGAGIRHGRDGAIANMRAIADLGLTNAAATVVATRGGRLALMSARISGRNQGSEVFLFDVLAVAEISAGERIAAVVVFDPDDIDAAVAELDSRYRAGEAAAHANTWSVIAGAHAGVNQHEFPPTTPNSVYIDHRPVVRVDAVDLAASLRALWDLAPDLSVYIEALHRLSEFGAVVTQALKGTSQEGFYAEWRAIDIFTVEGDSISRCEVFDEADLDAALARFDELNRPPPLRSSSSPDVLL